MSVYKDATRNSWYVKISTQIIMEKRSRQQSVVLKPKEKQVNGKRQKSLRETSAWICHFQNFMKYTRLI